MNTITREQLELVALPRDLVANLIRLAWSSAPGIRNEDAEALKTARAYLSAPPAPAEPEPVQCLRCGFVTYIKEGESPGKTTHREQMRRTEHLSLAPSHTPQEAPACSLSWNGFNLHGDEKSIKEAQRLLHEAGTVPELRALLAEARAQDAPEGLTDAALAAERERLCKAIKDEDDYCVEQGDYMLDSDDCIKIIQGKWVRPEFAIESATLAKVKPS